MSHVSVSVLCLSHRSFPLLCAATRKKKFNKMKGESEREKQKIIIKLNKQTQNNTEQWNRGTKQNESKKKKYGKVCVGTAPMYCFIFVTERLTVRETEHRWLVSICVQCTRGVYTHSVHTTYYIILF